MTIELNLNDEAKRFFDELMRETDALVVPRNKWKLYLEDNPRVSAADMPKHMFAEDFVITERDYFRSVIDSLGYLYYLPVRLTKSEGGFWFAKILEPKKTLPKRDIFDAGHRQDGSFGSNGNY